jgi:uncharacterized protein YebE (UPF0316 family)
MLYPALSIFFLRLVDVTLYSLRLMMVVRGRKIWAWLLGFCQAFIFVTVIREVLTDMEDWVKVLGYAAGFATGLVLGMVVEARLPMGYTHLRIISPGLGVKIADALRAQGYGVTEVPAKGMQGTVTLLNCSLQRRQTTRAIEIVAQADPEAFVTTESVRSIQRGFWGT